VDATLTVTASIYVSLEEVDWNIMVPASMTTTQTRNVTATFHLHGENSQEEHDDVNTFDEYIKTLPVHEKWMIMHVEFIPGGGDMLKHCLENNRSLKIRTDGSVTL
jgi:hypothetical protein